MLRIIVATVAGLIAATPVIAGNFEFVVPGEPGLSLTITGYDKAGGQMFEATADRPEQRDGKRLYIVRIDETILNIAPTPSRKLRVIPRFWSGRFGCIAQELSFSISWSWFASALGFKPAVRLRPPAGHWHCINANFFLERTQGRGRCWPILLI